MVDGDPGLNRFIRHPQIKPRAEVLVRSSGGTPDRLEDLVGFDPNQSSRGNNIQCQIGSVRQDDLAALTDRVKRMDAVDRHAGIIDRRFLDPRGIDTRDGKDLAHRRGGTLGVHLEHELALHGTDELDGDHLPLLVVDRHPLADLGLGRGNIQNPVAQGNSDPQLGQFATQHLVVQKHVGVHQSVTHRDMLVVRDTGQQVHVRLLTDTGVPQGRDLGSGAQPGPNSCPPLVRFDRQCHQARRQIDRLLGSRNRQFERGHPHRRTVEIKGVSVSRCTDAGRQFECHRMGTRFGEQQGVLAGSGTTQQHLGRLAIANRRHLANRCLAKPDRNLRPTLAQYLHAQRGSDPGQILVNGGHIIGLCDHTRNRRPLRNAISCTSPLPQTQVLHVGQEDRGGMLLKNRLQVTVRDVNPLLEFLVLGCCGSCNRFNRR